MIKIISIVILLAIVASGSCSQKEDSKPDPTKVNNATLIIATEGRIYNYNLDDKKIAWQYQNKLDTAGNRNYYVVDGQNIFMPFESGKFINFDVTTGEIIWQHQIFGKENESMAMSSDENQQAEMISAVMPLYMAMPLVDGENVLMASTGQPMQTEGYLYCFNRNTGAQKWLSHLQTPYNHYSPVKYCGNYFYNSAIFLEMLNAENGIATSYGMFDGEPEIAGETHNEPLNEPSQFEWPIFNQMQTDGESLFIGDERGSFYCLQLNKRTASVPGGDITDPNNTFIRNPKTFKWKFCDSTFTFQKNHSSSLNNDVLYTEMKTGMADTSCLFAIDTDKGAVKWEKVVIGDILNWTFNNGKICGYTDSFIFWIDESGENYRQIKVVSRPLSNIEWMDTTKLIYVSQKGIEVLDTITNTAMLISAMPMRINDYNNVQIKYISK